MEAKQRVDAAERKENPSSRSASIQRPACSITRRMSSAASSCRTDGFNQATTDEKRHQAMTGKLADESVTRLTSNHKTAEGQEQGGGKAEVGEGAGYRGRGRRRDGGRYRRGRRDRGHVGGSRGRVGDRTKHGGGGACKVGGGGGSVGRGGGRGGEKAGEREGIGHGGGGGEGGEHGGGTAEGGGRPCRPGFVWQLGCRLEAKDFMNNWYAAKIINIDDNDNTVLIHFDGWNQRYDEWVKMDSDRLRPLTRHSDRRKKAEKKSPSSKPVYKAGENVYARWSDCRMYPAKIVAVNTNGSYEVMFEDGVKKTVQAINVDMKPPLSSIGSGVRPAESTGKRNRHLSPDRASTDDSLTGTKDLPEEKLKTSRKLRGCSVRVNRCLSMTENENNVTCKKETVSVTGEEESSAAEVKMDDQDVKDEKTGTEHQQQSTEDVASDGSPVKRRLIHVKTIHGKLKKAVPPSPALPVDTKAEAEQGTKLKCPHSDCNKMFRNSTLVQYHIKYYHPEDKLEQPVPQPSEKRRNTSSFSELPASVHEFPSKRTKRSKTVDGQSFSAGASGRDEAVGMADQSPPSLSPSSVLPPHASPSPQGSKVTPKAESFFGRSRTKHRGMRHARKKHRIRQMRNRAVRKKVINCLCGVSRETSQLIQCTVCLCWQHLQCLEEEANLMKRYICKMCTHPQGLRESAKYSFHQDWLVEGRLADYDASLGGAAAAEPAYGSAGKAKIMKITHQLVADLHGVRQVIDSVNRCIFVATEKIEPELSHWKMLNTDDKTVSAVEHAEGVRLASACPSVNSKSTTKKVKRLPSNVTNGCKPQVEECVHYSEPDQLSTQEERISNCDKKTNEKTEHQQLADRANGRPITAAEIQEEDAGVDGAMDTSSSSAMTCNTFKDVVALNSTGVQFDNLSGSQPSSKNEQSNKEGAAMTGSERKLLNMWPNSQSVLTNEEDLKHDPSRDRKPKVPITASDNPQEDEGQEETEDEKMGDLSGSVTSSADEGEEEEGNSCQNHLLHYISQLQDGIEESIAIIEEQVTALESAEGNGNSTEDILRDLPRVKKTMNQLMTDLSKVQQISFCQ